ncbi:hypothetical protein Pelo_4161 [Pelomyxa schiedti]|nr:hypothetical protein Pelo_4161 [Pelomyxa schiedti]
MSPSPIPLVQPTSNATTTTTTSATTATTRTTTETSTSQTGTPPSTKPRSRSSPPRPSLSWSGSAPPFDPTVMLSEFNHIFYVVERVNLGKYAFGYRFETIVKHDVPDFEPAVPRKGVFTDLPAFRETLLTKIINGEKAACDAAQFRLRMLRTRQDHLSNMINDHY